MAGPDTGQGGMSSSRPYLIRALYEWIVDNGCTPHLLADAQASVAEVPQHYVENGRIILNLGPTAVRGLELGNDWIEFDARFGGVAMHVRLPVRAALAIYARENGQGMVFSEAAGTEPPEPPAPKKPKKPALKVVK
jgi:stringent starvation protein B